VNNDGLPDIFITAYYGCRYVDLYLQKPDHTYEMKTYEYGFKNTVTNKDAAWVDFDNDGKLDLASSDFESARSDCIITKLMEWQLCGNRFIKQFRKSFCYRSACHRYAGGQKYMQEVTAGRGQLMQKPSRLHFGLATTTL